MAGVVPEFQEAADERPHALLSTVEVGEAGDLCQTLPAIFPTTDNPIRNNSIIGSIC